MQKIRRVLSTFVHAPGILDAMEKKMDSGLAEMDGRLAPLEQAERGYVERIVKQVTGDTPFLKELNRSLSNCPTVWGDEARLHISPKASVHTCLFNTNSGDITIGDYTFAGSRVSVLAGSHDKRLTGFLRRDAEMTEGCDITVGSGVWLGSGCMLLGPCRIGDNAVIAAGAVVVPGTEVAAGTVWGGVPAKEIAKLEMSGEEEAAAVQEALERSGGLLFTEGWSPKVYGLGRCPLYELEGEGRVLTNRDGATLVYWREEKDDGPATASPIVIGGEGFRQEIEAAGKEGEIPVSWPNPEGKTICLRISRKAEEGALFLTLKRKEGTE